MSKVDGLFVEIYKATLEFLGKLAVPGAILVLVLSFQDEISNTFEGLRLSSLETPLGSARFEEIIEDLANAEPSSDEEQRVIRKIEAQEELVRAEIESGLRRQIPVEGVLLPKNPVANDIQPETSWATALNTSWVKPNDLFGRTYFLKVDTDLFIWPVRLDASSGQAMFTVNTSGNSADTGQIIAEDIWISEGDSFQFNFKNRTYRINLISLKMAGSIPSHAAYISVDVK